MACPRDLVTTPLCALLLTFCVPKDGLDETGAGTTAATESSVGPKPTTGASGTDGTGTTDTGTTDTGSPTTTSTTDTGNDDGTTQGDTGEFPPECSEKRPGVSAAFELIEMISGSFEGPCTVDTVDVEAGTVKTGMTCEVDNGTEPVLLTTADAIEGPPAWAPGDAVLLHHVHSTDPDLGVTTRRFDLRLAVDGSLLVAGIDHYSLKSEWAAPIALERSYPCGPVLPGGLFNPHTPFQIDLELAGATLSLIAYHRGTLPIDDAQVFAVDVEQADMNLCCDFEGGHWQHLLIRRVKTP